MQQKTGELPKPPFLIDESAFIYKNLTTNSNFLQINLLGSKKNTQGIGTKVKIYTGDEIQFLEKTSNRGFFSGSESLLHFGLGNQSTIDKIEITWMDGRTHVMENVSSNQRLIIKHSLIEND